MNVGVLATSGTPMLADRFHTGYFTTAKYVELYMYPGDTVIFVAVNWSENGAAEFMRVRIMELRAFDPRRNLTLFELKDKYDYLGRNKDAMRSAKRWLSGIAPKIRRAVKREMRKTLRHARYSR